VDGYILRRVDLLCYDFSLLFGPFLLFKVIDFPWHFYSDFDFLLFDFEFLLSPFFEIDDFYFYFLLPIFWEYFNLSAK